MADQNSSLDLLFNLLPPAKAATVGLRTFDLDSSGPLPDDLLQPLPALPSIFNSPAAVDSPVLPEKAGPWLAPAAAPAPLPAAGVASPSGLWIDGGVVMCACPDCRAPMSVRLWLMIADCWQCGTSIELSEEQEKEALRLVAEHERQQARPPYGGLTTGRAGGRAAGTAPAAALPAAGIPSTASPVSTTPAPTSPAAASPSAAPISSVPPVAGEMAGAPRAEAGSGGGGGTAARVASPPAIGPRPAETSEPAAVRGDAAAATTLAPAVPATPARTAGKAAAPAASTAASPLVPAAREVPGNRPTGGAQVCRPAGGTRAPAGAVSATLRSPVRVQATSHVHAFVRDLFRDMPAWVISLIFHVVLITLLGFIEFPSEQDETITLSASISQRELEGGHLAAQDPNAEFKFDLPLPANANLNDPKTRESLIAADQEARRLRLDPNAPSPYLPPLEKVRADASASHSSNSMLALRDQRIRREVVAQEGGTTLTEAAVSRGLHWLAEHQFPEGHWSLNARPAGCNCDRMGGMHSTSGGTSLALLPFLGAGQTHQVGHYRKHVALGLRALLKLQKPDGDLRADSSGNAGMYAHGQASIVLCEAFKITGDEALRIPAQKAIDFIVKAQHPQGGWRYAPREPGDTSVLGWQLMALQSAKAANLTVPDETLALAQQFLDSVDPSLREDQGKRARRPAGNDDFLEYEYQPRNHTSHAMTSEALLCRMYLGWDRSTNEGALLRGGRYLAEQYPPRPDQWNIYHWYYATQVLHHLGGAPWERWNVLMRDTLVNSQETSGHAAGSWAPAGQHEDQGGRIYVTSLAVCTLEIYYRHAPIFRQLDLRAR